MDEETQVLTTRGRERTDRTGTKMDVAKGGHRFCVAAFWGFSRFSHTHTRARAHTYGILLRRKSGSFPKPRTASPPVPTAIWRPVRERALPPLLLCFGAHSRGDDRPRASFGGPRETYLRGMWSAGKRAITVFIGR